MTILEYQRKRDSIAVSDAPSEIKEKAIQKLNLDFSASSAPTELTKQQLLESAPDTNDIGDH